MKSTLRGALYNLRKLHCLLPETPVRTPAQYCHNSAIPLNSDVSCTKRNMPVNEMASRAHSRGRTVRDEAVHTRSLSRERDGKSTNKRKSRSAPRRSLRRSRSRSRSLSRGRREGARYGRRSRSRSFDRNNRRHRRSSSRSCSPHDRRGRSPASPTSRGSGDDRSRRTEAKERDNKDKKMKQGKKAKKDKKKSSRKSTSPPARLDQAGERDSEPVGKGSNSPETTTETSTNDNAKAFFARLKQQESSKQMTGTVHASGVRPAVSSSTASTDQWECSKAGCGNKNSKYSTACNKCGAMKRMSEWR